MDLGALAFIVLFVVSSLIALLKGDSYIRAAGALSVTAAIATRLFERSGFAKPEDGIFVVDVCLAAAFGLLAYASKARSIAGCAMFQMLAVTTHLVRFTLLPDVAPLAYFDAAGIWSFPVMVLLIVGAIQKQDARSDEHSGPGDVRLLENGHEPDHRTEEVWLLRDLLTAGNTGSATEQRADRIVDRLGNLARVLSAPPSVLRQEGISGRAIELLRLCRRTMHVVTRNRAEEKLRILSIEGAVEYLKVCIGSLQHEEFHVLHLSLNGSLLHDELHASGDLSTCVVNKEQIIATSLRVGAALILLAHNHPSGNAKPSSEDYRLTRRIHRFATQFKISVFDHIIVSSSSWSSMRLDRSLNEVLYTDSALAAE